MYRLMSAVVALTIGVTALSTYAAAGETHVVQMLNKHPTEKRRRNVFIPEVVRIKPGDKVVFKSVDRGHNSISIKGMIPEGAEPWKSKLSRDFEVTLTVPGVYGYMCLPHYALGMVGVIVVEGDGVAESLAKAKTKKQRGKARKIFEDLLAKIEVANPS
ncbi:MAG: pseudoazurin [Pseudomonadota bacterium]